MKIDVEGSELACLLGGRDTLSLHQPSLLLEVNPGSAAAAGWDFRSLIDLLLSLGYERYALCTELSRALSLETLDSSVQRNTVILSPRLAT
jgi:hypothetical protein